MSLADPQSIKIGASTISLPRISTGNRSSEYASEDGTKSLKVQTTESKGGRKRQVIRLDLSKVTSDPFNTSQNQLVSSSAYLVVDRPPSGWTNAEALEFVKGLHEALGVSEFAMVKKVLASES